MTLGEESRFGLRATGGEAQELEGYAPLNRLFLLGEVDLSHTPLTPQLNDPIRTDLAWHLGRRCGGVLKRALLSCEEAFGLSLVG
jgi:hypothetical protein